VGGCPASWEAVLTPDGRQQRRWPDDDVDHGAPTGAEVDKAAVPVLPVTLDELVLTAKECEAVGASVIHVHIRDADARPPSTRAGCATPWSRCVSRPI
jgi:hypothetical protein